MPKMTMRGAVIMSWSGEGQGSGQYLVLEMGVDFSDKVRSEMENWDTSAALEELYPGLREKDQPKFTRAAMLIPRAVRQMNLEGKVRATSIELIPNGRELAGNAISIQCSEFKNFTLHRVKQPNGTFDWQLRFDAVLPNTDSVDDVVQYRSVIGDGKAQMKVGYEVQEKLDLAEDEGAAVDTGDQERLISEEQAADTAEEEGEDELPRTAPPKSHQRPKKDAPGSRRGAEQIPDPVVQ